MSPTAKATAGTISACTATTGQGSRPHTPLSAMTAVSSAAPQTMRARAAARAATETNATAGTQKLSEG
ncbi:MULTISPECIES: hypothetical protein [Streptomyces]|uniref:hypothetical protein n=1 Tax=Streptomyces TaxID=1883 RepID=UPI001587EB09|nr:hypothetical protein [Streptomyces sp. CAI-85]NUV58174.1 hypothetical protein [Streptomyces sp. CAI-85]